MIKLKSILLTTGLSFSSLCFSSSAPEILNLRNKGFKVPRVQSRYLSTEQLLNAALKQNFLDFRSALDQADLTATYSSQEKYTALHLVTLHSWTKGAREILKAENRPANFVNALDQHARTALHYAARIGNAEIVKAILESTIEVQTNLRDFSGKTAAELASQQANVNIDYARHYAEEALKATAKANKPDLVEAAKHGDPLAIATIDEANLTFRTSRQKMRAFTRAAESCDRCTILIEAYNLKRDSYEKAKEVHHELSTRRDRLRHRALKAKAEEYVAREAGMLPRSYYQEFKPKSPRIERKESFRQSQKLNDEYPREFQATPEPYPSTRIEATKPRAVLLDPDINECDDAYAPRDVTYISWRRGNRVINVEIDGAASFTYDPNEEW